MGKTELNAGRKKGQSLGHYGVTAGDRHTEALLVGHDLMVMHRLIMDIS